MPGVLGPGDGWDGGNGGTGTVGDRWPPSYRDANVPETGTLQILLGEGEVDGLVNGLKSVYLEGTPIQNGDGSMNFSAVALALTSGTNTQGAVEGITGTESETAVGVQVTQASPVTRSVTSNPSAVRVRVSIPTLKLINSTTGKQDGHTVTIKIERQNASYTPSGGALGDWEEVPLENGGAIVGGPFSTKFTKSYRIETPTTGTWQIRVTRVSADDADVYHQSQTWFDAYTEIVDALLRYPNSSVLAIRVNAKQFKSIPRVTCEMKLKKVLVPSNYDPATRTYYTTGFGTSGGAWDGTFGDWATSTVGKKVWTDNPAWVFYDVATATRYGAGSFIDVTALDKWTLYGIAQWCDAINPSTGLYVGVSDGKGGTEPRITLNIYMQSPQNAIKALGALASIFWGVVYYSGGLIVPVADSDTAPVALFTNANVKAGKFTYEGTARSARHTAAVVSFINPDLGWNQDVAVYEDQAGIARFGYNVLDMQGLGCTSQGQALRLGKWAILTELLSSETISFTTGLEGSTCRPGDVIQVADQFRAGAIRNGGRCAAASSTTVINLDAPVTLAAGTNYLKIKTTAGVVETRTITTGAGTTQAVTVSSAFSEAPAAGQGWMVQAGTTAATYRVIGVKQGEGLEYQVVALLHDPAKYTALGLTSGDVIPRTPLPTSTTAPAGLAVTSTERILNDRQVLTLAASWTLDAAAGYIAQASRDYGPWENMTVAGAQAVLDGIQPGVWRVRVAGDWRTAGMSPWAEVSGTVGASSNPPTWVDNTMKGDIQSPNYTAGTSSTAPVGFRMHQTAFTTTYIGGATDVTCQMELGGSANFGGYQVQTVNSRVMTAVNRILNGTFYIDVASGWAQQNNYWVWNSASSTTGGGSATLVTTAFPYGDRLVQGLSTPPTNQTVNLTLSTAMTSAANDVATGSVKAYLFDCATGTETLLATWSYSGTRPTTPSWTAQSVDITSSVSAGGDFVLRLAGTIATGTGGDTVTLFVDNVKIVS